MLQGNRFKAGRKGSEHRHNYAATLGTGWSFAGAIALAHLSFATQIAFAAMIGRFNLGMLDKAKQALKPID
jgi:hypothetical protein